MQFYLFFDDVIIHQFPSYYSKVKGKEKNNKQGFSKRQNILTTWKSRNETLALHMCRTGQAVTGKQWKLSLGLSSSYGPLSASEAWPGCLLSKPKLHTGYLAMLLMEKSPTSRQKLWKNIGTYEMSTLNIHIRYDSYLPVDITKPTGLADYFRFTIPKLIFFKKRDFFISALLVISQCYTFNI